MVEWSNGALLLFFILCAAGLLLSSVLRGRYAAFLIASFGTVCSILLVFAAVARLAGGRDFHLDLWTLNGWGSLSLQVDALSAVFLFAAGLVYLSCCIFAPDYLLHYFRNRYPAGRYAALHFALMASVAIILTAGDALTFLLSWECMSVLCYLLVNYEQKQQPDSVAGYIMLAMSEAGFLAAVIAFLVVGSGASAFSFAALRAASAHLSGAAAWGVFLLGFLGFGVKAGLVPVNFWLPRCYTASPPAFIPVLAGVTLNLGFYGILRLNGDLVPGQGIGPGLIALVLGSITALVGKMPGSSPQVSEPFWFSGIRGTPYLQPLL
jgi:hydrogenase-4 component B